MELQCRVALDEWVYSPATMPVYTLIVNGIPHSYDADVAPMIGQVVILDDGSSAGVVRSTDGGRVFNAETAPPEEGGGANG